MNDTDILNKISGIIRSYADRLMPISPSLSQSMVRGIETLRGDGRRQPEDFTRTMGGIRAPEAAGRSFWKCAHYPIATDNYFSRSTCEHGCHSNEPRWFDNGTSV